MWACFAVRSAALCLVPVSIERMLVSGLISVFACRIRLRLELIMIAPSILQSSKSFCEVNLELILNPPSMMFWDCRSFESRTISAPSLALIMSSITDLRDVPGETNFIKSKNVLSFSVIMV